MDKTYGKSDIIETRHPVVIHEDRPERPPQFSDRPGPVLQSHPRPIPQPISQPIPQGNGLDRERYDHFHSYSALNHNSQPPVKVIDSTPGISFQMQSRVPPPSHPPSHTQSHFST